MEEKSSGAILSGAIPSDVLQLRAVGTIRTACGTTQKHAGSDGERHRVCDRDSLPLSISHLLRPQEPPAPGGAGGGGVRRRRPHLHPRPHSRPPPQSPSRHRRQHLHGR